MRHRICSGITGLGNSSDCLLPNIFSQNEGLNAVAKLMFEDALKLQPIEEYGGFDFKVEYEQGNFSIDFGYEPAYQYDELLIYNITTTKDNCRIRKGKAKGLYGSDIEIIKDIKYKDVDIEFKELINKWHDRLLQSV